MAIIPPLALILVVLGSIFAGHRHANGILRPGRHRRHRAVLIYRQFSFRMVWESSLETVKVTAMVFAILLGATAFSMAFTYTGGDWIVEDFDAASRARNGAS